MIPNKHQLVSEIMKLPIDLTDNLHSTDSILSKSTEESVLIIDAMCVVQSFKVAKDIQSASKLADLFVTKIRSMAANYNEVRVLFDRYLDVSLKHMTRTKRVSKTPVVHYHVTDSTPVRNMKTFLAHVRTKDEVTCYLAEKLLAAFKQEKKAVVVSFRNVVQSNVQLDEVVSLPELQEGRHELEEADQQIILHAIDIGRRVPQPKLSVYSLDTDVLVLLTGFYTQIPSQTTVIRKADEKIFISEIYYRLGCHRAEALIGWYAFKGCDNTGSFSTKSLKSNFSAFLASDADILSAFSSFGTDLNVQPHIYKQMERYVCLLYRPSSSEVSSIKELRWYMFAKCGKEGRQLPPTLGTLKPHTNRAYYMTLLWKKSVTPCPALPACTEFSWESIDGCLRPTYCTLPPAPEALLSLRKCSCSSGCKTNACGCVKNKLVCTDLCQCVDNCKNIE
jgi:hypothetical protein